MLRSLVQSAKRHPPREIAGSDRVLRAIVERRRALLAGKSREDGRRIGLVVEGGAMRGIVSGGALVGLDDLGLMDVFDVAYGASAGAINLAYVVGGTGDRAAVIYTRHAASPLFVNPLRLGKVIDLDYMFDTIIRESYPFDIERLRTAPCEVKVSVTDAVTGRNRLVSLRDEAVDPYALLKASAAVPFYYGRRVQILGSHFVDGMASDALPVRAALAEGCTDVLVLLSTRPGEGSARASGRFRHDIAWPERLMLSRHPSGFRRAYLTRRRRLRRELTQASNDDRVHVLHPGTGCPVPSRICRDSAELTRAFEAARSRSRAVFEHLGLTAK